MPLLQDLHDSYRKSLPASFTNYMRYGLTNIAKAHGLKAPKR